VQATATGRTQGAIEALRAHWPEYLMEAAELGMFMISACVCGVVLPRWIADGFWLRAASGAAMGVTAVAIICSPWGQRSGTHMNPAVTLACLTLGKVERSDAIFYIAAQFAGGTAGVVLSALVLGPALARAQYVATVPGPGGPSVALGAEFAISFVLLSAVLRVANSRRWRRLTPFVAGALVATYIAVESPLSGMSMNPARSFASALPAAIWTDFWIYIVAPIVATVAAAQFYGGGPVFCAKFHHHNRRRCIFRCRYGDPCAGRHSASGAGALRETEVRRSRGVTGE
jgi:aquaporin Z